MKQPRVILLVPFAREFDRGVRRGIVEYAHAHGPWIFYEQAPPYLRVLTRRQRLASIRKWNADGVIVLQTQMSDVHSLGLPTVVVIGTRRLPEPFFQLVCNNDDIGKMGATTLLGLGLHHFAYCGLAGLEFSKVRGSSFIETIKQAGFAAHVYSAPAPYSGKSWYTEERELARWLTALPKPIGLMACNDDRARMISEICRMQDLRVPDDIAILGVDNDEQVCQSASPPLSSVALATERAGYEAAALLNRMMSGQKISQRCVTAHPTHVVTRQSTDILAVEDPNILKALRFTRQNSNRMIRVRDVAAVAGLSRRVLQDRFRRSVGRTPIEEIHRCRVDYIARMLVETNMTVGEIATATGFEIDAHIARFFARQTGITPLAYRKKHWPR